MMTDRRWEKVQILLLGVGWGVSQRQAMGWLIASFQQASFLNMALVVVVLGVWIYQGIQAYRHSPASGPGSVFAWRPWPLGILLGSALLSGALRGSGGSELWGVILLGVGSYAFAGLWMDPYRWRQGSLMALLVAAVLPFSVQWGSGLGFPARMLTAQWVERILTYLGVTAISAHDVIVLENGIAHVDLPCSGLKSLWTGTVFFLGCSGLEQRRVGCRWVVALVVGISSLMVVNIVRVLVLVLLDGALAWPIAAEIVHVPLGVLGFAAACVGMWGLLQWVPATTRPDHVEPSESVPSRYRSALIVSLLCLALVPLPSVGSLPTAQLDLQWPRSMQMDPLPLTPAEEQFFAQSDQVAAQKYQFEWEDVAGSVLVVASPSWRFHHAPELCFTGNGLRVDQMQAAMLSGAIPIRWLALQDQQLSAMYWFQSATHTTDNLVTRIWDHLRHQDQVWVMVSILFDQYYEPEMDPVQTVGGLVHAVVVPSLEASV